MPDIGHEKTEKMLGSMKRRLDKVYKQAADETKDKYFAYIERFEKLNEKKLDDLKKGKITQDEYNKWRKNAMFTGKRYQQLADTMASDLTMTNEKAMSIVNGYIPEAYALNRNYAMYQLAVAGAFELDATFLLYDRHTVEKLVKEKTILLPKPKVDIPKDKRWNKAHIRNAITQGVLQGESNEKIAKRLQKVVGMDKSSAIRNARTAMTGAQNAGRVDSYGYAKKKFGINVMKEWKAVSDSVTRQSHRRINGERVGIDDTFSNGCRYPADPMGAPEEVYNCRCTLLPYMPDYDFDEDKVGEESNFDEWVEENSE